MSEEHDETLCGHPAGHVIVGAGGRAECRDCGREVAIVVGSSTWTARDARRH